MLVRYLIPISLLTTALCTACSFVPAPHRVGGKASGDIFEDRELRQLADAACVGDASRIERLVTSGVDVNGQGFEGMTPLIWALTCESHDGMGALLDQGADPNQRTREGTGENAVIFAATYFDESLLALLLENGGDPNSHTLRSSPTFALLDAYRMGDLNDDWDTFRLLQEAGASPVLQESAEIGPTQSVMDMQIRNNELCDALDYFEQGFFPSPRRRVPNLIALHHDGGTEEPCRRSLIDYIEAELTEDEIGIYRGWQGRRGLQISYSSILDTQ